MSAAISMRGLGKTFGGVTALADLTLDVPEGSVFGFLGPNAAGKTTAIRILAGLAVPTSGSATVAGLDVSVGWARMNVGYLGQEPRFYGWMSGPDVLRYVAGFYPWVSDPIPARVVDVLRQVGLEGVGDRPTRTYSGGMRQRLGIAQALIGRPRVLLLDEPASALDPVGRRDVLDLMAGLREHATIFYSTHILADVERVADHVAILDHGRLVRTAPTHDLLASFNRDRLRVSFRGETVGLEPALRSVAGVTSVTAESHDGATSFVLATAPQQLEAVQRAIPQFAISHGLVLVANTTDAVDLEDVFIRLVTPKERAA